MPQDGLLNVLVVDDHELVRTGMRRLLEENPLIGHIAEASSGEQALEMADMQVGDHVGDHVGDRPAGQAFDIVLMDINLPGISGLEASKEMLSRVPDSRIIIVTGQLDGAHIPTLLNAGVLGYITKGSSAEEMG